MTAPVLTLDGVGHAYLGRTVIDGISLAIGRGEVVALVGPSGSGKSTLVHVAAGLIDPRAGRVNRAYARHAMVFQEPRLLPWATAAANIAFPLRLAGLGRAARQARVVAGADLVALTAEDLAKFPVALSGGMRQRVAIARALAVAPDFIYFDEPFTALDFALKRRFQDLVIAAAAAAHFAALFVTHDLHEAARIADRLLVLAPDGHGIAGERRPPGRPGARDETAVFATVQGWLADDPLFRPLLDTDERRTG